MYILNSSGFPRTFSEIFNNVESDLHFNVKSGPEDYPKKALLFLSPCVFVGHHVSFELQKLRE